MPALFTRQSILPSVLKICMKAALTLAASVISITIGWICSLLVANSCLSQAYTIAPSATNCSAICFPMPCAAPVMIQTLFSRSLDIINYIRDLPPSMVIEVPVIHLVASDSRYTIAWATSVGVP